MPKPKPSFLIPAILAAWSIVPSAEASDFATRMMEVTFKFYHPDSTSTCFLLKRDAPDPAYYLVTTAHTVERTRGETAILVLRKEKRDGSYDRGDHTIAVRRGDRPLWVRHPTQDVAALRLSEPLPIPVPGLPVSTLTDETSLKAARVHIGSPLLILTFPQRFEANGAGFPVARQGIFASPPLLPMATHPTFLADFTTFAGDSGGPVFAEGPDELPLIYGIVTAQHYHDDKIKTEYEERIIRHPLGMGTVLHARYVREAVEAAAAPPSGNSDSKPGKKP